MTFVISNHQARRYSNSVGGYGDEEVRFDEDLFAIGWVKALDPESKCYYYFTLDRAYIDLFC